MNEITRWLTDDLIARHEQADDRMECPSCKEIALRLTDEEISEDDTMSYSTYECGRCGYLEVHSSSLPSWYNEGGPSPEGINRGDDDE